MKQKRIAIIDDDPFLVAHLQQAIAERLADVEVVGIEDPVAPAGFDAYVVYREFGGDSRGHEVIAGQDRVGVAPDGAGGGELPRLRTRLLQPEGHARADICLGASVQIGERLVRAQRALRQLLAIASLGDNLLMIMPGAGGRGPGGTRTAGQAFEIADVEAIARDVSGVQVAPSQTQVTVAP